METSHFRSDLMDIKLSWLFIADNYKNLGDREKAYEVYKDLFSSLTSSLEPASLVEKYHYHLREWHHFTATVARTEGYKLDEGLCV